VMDLQVYCQVPAEEAVNLKARVVLIDDDNRTKE